VVGVVNHFFLGLIRGIEGLTADSFHDGGFAALAVTLRRIFWTVVPTLSVAVAMVIVMADFLGGLILPDHPQATASVARLLSLSLLISSARVILGNGLWAMNLPQATLPASLALGISTLGLGLLGAQYAGAVGVAVAVLLGDTISSVFLVSTYRSAWRGAAGD
jgi:O-antigen/teichoic acid export membrane protein